MLLVSTVSCQYYIAFKVYILVLLDVTSFSAPLACFGLVVVLADVSVKTLTKRDKDLELNRFRLREASAGVFPISVQLQDEIY